MNTQFIYVESSDPIVIRTLYLSVYSFVFV